MRQVSGGGVVMDFPRIVLQLVAALPRLNVYRSACGWWVEIVTRRSPRPAQLGQVVRV